MNVGQVLEAHLGYAARSRLADKTVAVDYKKTRPSTQPAVWVSSPVFDGAHWDEAEQSGVQGTIEQLFEQHEPRRRRRQRLVANDGKATLRRPYRRAYDRPVTVGYVYIMKLVATSSTTRSTPGPPART